MRLQTAGPILAILASATIAIAGTAAPATAQRAPLPAQAANSPDWMEPVEPFRIADNLYYVGVVDGNTIKLHNSRADAIAGVIPTPDRTFCIAS